MSDNLYKIELHNANRTKIQATNGDGSSTNANAKTGQPDGNVIINSVENFQLIPNSFIESSKAGKSTPSVQFGQRKTSEAANDRINIGPNAPMPEKANKLSSTTAASRKNVENAGANRHPKAVPNGVVPIQSSFDEVIGKKPDKVDQSPNENNRYANVVDDAGERKSSEDAVDSLKEKIGEMQNVNDNDNVAKEVNDNNDFVMDERSHKDHLHDAMQHNNAIKNAAEEDMNLYDNKVNVPKPKHAHALGDNLADDDFEMVHRGEEDDKNGQKLLREIDGDGGKVAYPESHLEEQNEEDDGKWIHYFHPLNGNN